MISSMFISECVRFAQRLSILQIQSLLRRKCEVIPDYFFVVANEISSDI